MSIVKWKYINGWETEGKLEPKHIIKWAYADNGYFTEQDEDILMYRPELISILYELMIDEHSKRKEDIFKILKNYANQTYAKTSDSQAIKEFEKLKATSSDNIKQLELIKLITELKKKAR